VNQKTLLVERDVPIKMRDKVVLRADVYRPDTTERVPVLLQRTPYGKGFAGTAFALLAAERGYAVVNQDTRGRWASEGDGYPWVHEKADGYDTVQWAAAQSWSDGQVGTFGMSYMGYTQFAAASTHPPALKTIIPNVTFCDPYTVGFRGGAVALGAGVSWNLLAGALMAVMQHSGNEPERQALMAQLVAAVDGMSRGETFRHLPLQGLPLIGRDGLVQFLADSIEHPTRDGYWESMGCPHTDIAIPALHIGGWYDIFIGDTTRDYAAIRQRGDPRQKLLIGPWTHGNYQPDVGEVDFGLQAAGHLVMPDELHLRWFDYWLKGIENGIMKEPPVRIFVMGENRWRFEEEWPLSRTRYSRFYLHSGGGANGLAGDGHLTPEPPVDEAVDSFVYDPRNPVPTRGGGLCCWGAALPPGAYDQREIESRPDILVYTTPVLEQGLEVTGPLQVHLWAVSSAPDTDFSAKLVDVSPCGYARNVQDGIVRARYREGSGTPTFIKPGEVYEYTIDLSATSNLFKAGHRIRLEISSSNFPRFDRNPNTGGPIGDETELRPAHQTILHDAAHPSHILLPVIPRDA
jgi:putative CocE/NonD family hydrolase